MWAQIRSAINSNLAVPLNTLITSIIGVVDPTPNTTTVMGYLRRLDDRHVTGVIRSIQRGSIIITASGAISATVTISAVNTAKSMVLYNGFNTSGASFSFGTFPRVALTSTTSVVAAIGSSAANQVFVSFEVVEYF